MKVSHLNLPALDEIRAELRRRDLEEARKNYKAYLQLAYKKRWKPAAHLDLICTHMEMVEAGFLDRLIFSMPPRHGKSMSVTEALPSWFIGKDPERRVIEASYGDVLARKFGRSNRRKVEQLGVELFGIEVSRDNSSATNWGIAGYRGGMLSAGILGGITGEGADLLLVDDPIKTRQEANSVTYRDRIWDEWQDSLLSRLHPGGRVVIIMTRWHEDDLVGRILTNTPDHWKVLNLPAIAEDDDPLGREPGELLWPDHGFDVEWAQRRKKEIGKQNWDALYQGRPSAAEGNLFKRRHYRYFKSHGEYFELITPQGPKHIARSDCKVFQACDVAGSIKTSANYFVLGTFALAPQGDLLILDIFRTRIEGPDQPAYINRMFHTHRPIVIGVESKNMGITLYQQLVRDGLPITELKPEADKYTRAIPAAARYESGAVYHLMGAHWLSAFEEELATFPNGQNDDQVDVTAYAVIMQMWGYVNRNIKPRDEVKVIGG